MRIFDSSGGPALLVHVPVCDAEWCLPDFLRGLDLQEWPAGIRDRTKLIFDVNGCTDQSHRILAAFAGTPHGFRHILIHELPWPPLPPGDRKWTPERIDRMIRLRNRGLDAFREYGADRFLAIDADVVLADPSTIAHWLAFQGPLLAGVFWSRWGNPAAQPLPNVWVCGRFELSAEFLEKVKTPGHHWVGGLGACVMMTRDVLRPNVNYDRIPNAPSNYDGEDRFFSLRAAVAGLDLRACTHHRIVHLDRAVPDLAMFLPWRAAALS